MFKQLKAKPVKLNRYIKHNKPKERKNSVEQKRCVRCGNTRGHISKYGLHLCRRCFREIATKIGFKKYD
ncbi:MAG: 30S ribosomal protein S14 [bacterium]|nr:30S ribosomal protein S14 [bacterium]